VIDSAPAFHGLVFCATKAETDEVARRLVEGGYAAEPSTATCPRKPGSALSDASATL
jgi:hypothetical protein